MLSYRFSDPQLPAYGLLGAPLINDEGAVIGVHVSSQRRDDGLRGRAVPSTRFIEPLVRSAAQEKPGPTVEVSGYTLTLPAAYTKVDGEQDLWQCLLANGREVRFQLQVGPNAKGFDVTDATMRKLMNAGVDRLTGGRSGTRCANGELVDRPGVRLIPGSLLDGLDGGIWPRGAAAE